MRRAVFIVDDRPTSGKGHVVRSGALADEMRSRGWECVYAPVDDIPPSDAVVVDLQSDYPVDGVKIHGGKRLMVIITDGVIAAEGWSLIVNGCAGAAPEMYQKTGASLVLAGPQYALLRPEFHERRAQLVPLDGDGPGSEWPDVARSPRLDLREISGLTGPEVADQILRAVLSAEEIVTYGGQRALEVACILGASPQANRVRLTVEARNSGELLNGRGLRDGAVVDGLGCKRVAQAIDRLSDARDVYKASCWRTIFESLANDGDSSVAVMSGRTPYTPEQLDALVADTIRGLELTKDDSLLDVGCAAGFVGEKLAPLAREYMGVDYCAGSVVMFTTRCPELKVQAASATALPFPDRHFDKVNLGSVLLCMTPAECIQALRELRRVATKRAFVSGNPCQPRPDQVFWFSREELCAMALHAGWEKATVVEVNPEIPDAAGLFDMVLEG